MGDGRPTLVIGATGLVGKACARALRQEGWPVVGTRCSRQEAQLQPLDMTDRHAVLTMAAHLEPSVVLLPAAYSNVDGCERDPDLATRINVQGAAHVIEACRQIGATLVFFSSEYVFDGRSGPYDETAPTHPINVYGRGKLAVERQIQEQLDAYLILRITTVFGYDRGSKNYAMQVLERVGKGHSIQSPADQISTPTHVDDVARLTCALLQRGARGVYHVAGRHRLSRYEFATALARMLELDERLVMPVSTAALHQVASRPLVAGLLTGKLSAQVGEEPWPLVRALRHFKEQWVAANERLLSGVNDRR